MAEETTPIVNADKGDAEVNDTTLTEQPENTDEALVDTTLEFIEGSSNVILVAPHGHKSNDIRTGKLVRQIAGKIKCYAIINKKYAKPKDNSEPDKKGFKVNLNNIPQVKQHLKTEFLEPLKNYKDEIIKKYGEAVILWIHGAEDKHIIGDVVDKNIAPIVKILVGYGQKKGENNRLTAKEETVNNIIAALDAHGLKAILANPNKRVYRNNYSYCGSALHNMNQFFFSDKGVQSLQLEIKESDCRDTMLNVKATAKAMSEAIANAISTPAIIPEVMVQNKVVTDLVKPKAMSEEEKKIETAYNKLKEIFAVNFYNTLVEAGNYLIKMFFDDDYKKVAPETMKKNSSLNKLFIRLNKETSGNAPKKSWLYDSIKIAIFDKKYSELFPNLETTVCTSHKLKLISSGFDEELQLQLLHEVQEKQYTVLGLARRINELRGKPEISNATVTKPDFTSFLKSLQTVSGNTLKELFEDNELIEMKTQLQAEIDKITAVLKPQQEEVPATPPAPITTA